MKQMKLRSSGMLKKQHDWIRLLFSLLGESYCKEVEGARDGTQVGPQTYQSAAHLRSSFLLLVVWPGAPIVASDRS